MKKTISLAALICLTALSAISAVRHFSVNVEGQTGHVQGIAYDAAVSKMYFSFTTRFIVTDNDGHIIGSIDKIHGHLGAMTFDARGRKVYASLECKNDEIGASISKRLGEKGYTESSFYIAEIDVDAVKTTGIPEKDAIRRIPVPQAGEDYKAEVSYGGRSFQHRYGCTGIDGITIGPDFGGKGGEYLYVAYGIKSDTTRTDNDYQILLQYKMDDVRKGAASSVRRYFIKTGNTRYGVQNLAYDSFTGHMFMAVYKGEKNQYPNYDLFAVDMASKPVKARLEGVPYEKGKVDVVPLAGKGWHFKYGSLGLCPLGDGNWYIAEGGKKKDKLTGKKLRTGKAVLYRWIPGADTPFKRVEAFPEQGSFNQKWSKGPGWLEDAVIYQIYPSSFKDSDGDGIGDLKGIEFKLDYIASLGVKCIWLNPIFVSDFIDGGYDVIDFYEVDPRFGTNGDLVRLVAKAHEKGIRVMLDLVAGHTSIKCDWFKQSCAGPDRRYSDYYIWSDRLPDKKAEDILKEMLQDPNYMQNTKGKWMASDYPRNKYYMKNFYACQPALNYGFAKPDSSHPWEQGVNDEGPKAVREELKNIMAFWFGKGIDGFRVDMANSLVKNDRDHKATMKLWRGIRQWMDKNYPDRAIMAEWSNPSICLAAGFNIDMDLNAMNTATRYMYFDNKHQADGGSYFSLNGGLASEKDLYGNPWPEDDIDRSVTPEIMLRNYFAHMTESLSSTSGYGWFATITGNHDHLRMNTGGRNTPQQLKVMMTWVMCMPMPILYYGDEIGMRSLAGLPNVEGANHNGKERAGGRTPMQWEEGPTAGFSTCSPEKLYLPVCPYWTDANNYQDYLEQLSGGKMKTLAKGSPTVQSQEDDRNSLLEWTKTLIALRKHNKAFQANSSFVPIETGKAYPMVFLRSDNNDTFIVALNPTGKMQSAELNSVLPQGKSLETILVSGSAKVSKAQLTLNATSAIILKIK